MGLEYGRCLHEGRSEQEILQKVRIHLISSYLFPAALYAAKHTVQSAALLSCRALADIEKGGSGLDLKGGRRPLLSESGVASLNQELLLSAKSCRAVRQHEFGAVLRSAISDDNNSSFVDITLDPKTIKKYK